MTGGGFQLVFSGDSVLEELVAAFSDLHGFPFSCSCRAGSPVSRFRVVVADGGDATAISRDLAHHLASHAAAFAAATPARIRVLPLERDWARAHRRYLHGRAVAGRFFIHPPWENPEVPAGLVCIVIDPGASFGTGHHPTTELCLSWLAGVSAPGIRVLDAGCGSGVLAIAAVLIGAAEAAGFDIDAAAVDCADANAARNAVEGRCRFLANMPECPPGGCFDLVLANMLPAEFLPLAAALGQRLVPGGRILFSGIDRGQLERTVAALAGEGFVPGERLVAGDWAAVAACVAAGHAVPDAG